MADHVVSFSNDIGNLPKPHSEISETSEFNNPCLFMDGSGVKSFQTTLAELGTDYHTKKKLQDELALKRTYESIHSSLETCSDIIGDSLDQSLFKIVYPDRMSYGFFSDLLPGGKMYITGFVNKHHLDLLPMFHQKFKLNPINHTFEMRFFDNYINNVLPPNNIISLYNSDNHVLTIAEYINKNIIDDVSVDVIYDNLLDKPFFVLRKILISDEDPKELLFNDIKTLTDKLENDVKTHIAKEREKFKKFSDSNDVVVFDLSMLHLADEQTAVEMYEEFCKTICITPNTKKFIEYHAYVNRYNKQSVGKTPVGCAVGNLLSDISKIMLGRSSIFTETDLTSINWNVGCDIGVRVMYPEFNRTTERTIGDIINTINSISN